MCRDVKLIFLCLVTPIAIWCLRAIFYLLISFSNKGMAVASKSDLRISTHLVGLRYWAAFPDEYALSTGRKLVWTGNGYTIELNPISRVMQVHSAKFVHDANLTYDGWRWQGFTHIPGRTLPVKVDVW